jgi:hypothetical protein
MPKLINFRANEQDERTISALKKKMGGSVASIIREALRELKKREGIK